MESWRQDDRRGGRAHPDRVGPYRITGVLGEGGMGVVYRAEQDEPVRRTVALKLVRGGFEFTDFAVRFEAERQALALLEHEHIARLYDAGRTDEGWTWFAMELVDGVPLTEFGEGRRLSIRDRLALFLPICRAVQHAHQKGLIHRDLKPNNILVAEQDGVPVPKVIDFGIAKAFNRRLTDETLVTEVGMVVGTPAYMSPEQAEGAGLDVDTRADVYSLGVMLYELLTGTLPVDPTGLGLVPFIARLVSRATLPPTPSDRVREAGAPAQAEGSLADRAALARELRGDLDAIVLKAMAPERDRRYETVRDLVLDIERHLSHQPVLARAPSRLYRAGKFVRRHPTGVALAASLMVFLAGVTAVTLVQSRRVERARVVAEQRRGQAEELLSYLVGDLRDKLEPIGRLEILNEANDRAMAYFAAVPASELSDDESFRRSQVLSQMGQTHLAAGDLERAVQAFRESLELTLDLAERDPAHAERQVGLGAAYFWVGYVHYLRNALDSALAQFEPYLAVSRGLVERDSTNLDWLLELGYAHSNIGSVKEGLGDLPGAIESFRFTLGVKQRLAEARPDDLDRRMELGITHNALGRAFERNGQLDSARVHYSADLALRESAAAADTANTKRRVSLVYSLAHRAGVERLLGQLGPARAFQDSAHRLAWSLHRRDPANAEWVREAAAAGVRLAAMDLALGRTAASRDELQRSLGMLAELVRRDATNSDYIRQLALAELELSRAHLALGDLAAAGTAARRSEGLLVPLAEGAGVERAVMVGLAEVRVLAAEVEERRGAAEAARGFREAALTALGPDPSRDELEGVVVRARALAGLGRWPEASTAVARLQQMGYNGPGFPRLVERVAAADLR